MVRDKGNRGLHHVGEEAGKGKGLAGIALDTQAVGRSSGQVGLLLIEPQVRPTGQETQPGQDGGGIRSEDDAAEGVEEQEQSREMLDAHFDQALENRDGVFWHELLECDEEGGLDGNTTADLGQTRQEKKG